MRKQKRRREEKNKRRRKRVQYFTVGGFTTLLRANHTTGSNTGTVTSA